MVKKVMVSKQPAYLAERFQDVELEEGSRVLDRNVGEVRQVDRKLAVSRGGFVYQGCKIYNKVPLSLRKEKNIKKFKKSMKLWVKENVDPKLGFKV